MAPDIEESIGGISGRVCILLRLLPDSFSSSFVYLLEYGIFGSDILDEPNNLV
jgi:hypothetical protein